jgi:hypothetical protein
VASLVACAVYLTAFRSVLPVEDLMGDTPLAGLWFSLAVVAFALLTVQDAVLTGLRQATWVPLKNGLHGLAKLVLVVAFAGTLHLAEDYTQLEQDVEHVEHHSSYPHCASSSLRQLRGAPRARSRQRPTAASAADNEMSSSSLDAKVAKVSSGHQTATMSEFGPLWL